MPQLLSNESATGSVVQWGGGTGVFAVAGTFGGTSASLQFLGPDGSTWIEAGTDTTKTAAGGGVFVLPPCRIRCALTGGTPSGMYAQAELVR